jgi:hypothetical protein
MRTGAYVWLYGPAESVEQTGAWGDAELTHPGVLIIGSDGSRELLAVDTRNSSPPVVCVDISSSGWSAAQEQAASIETFVRAIEEGRFEFAFQE